MAKVVLIITEQFDVTADYVVNAFNDRDTEVVRFDTAEFPQNIVATTRLDESWSGSIKEQTGRLMRALNLRFGALDFIVTPSGEWVWLEINPNGQWAWIEDLTPRIATAIADALEGSTRL